MKTNKLNMLPLAVMISVSPMVTPVLADKPHGSPAAPATGATDDWREEYAYTLGVQAAVFTYPWLYFAHLRYGWMGQEKPAGYKGIDMPLNEFYHFRNTVDAGYRAGGSPNNDTLYSLLFLDDGAGWCRFGSEHVEHASASGREPLGDQRPQVVHYRL